MSTMQNLAFGLSERSEIEDDLTIPIIILQIRDFLAEMAESALRQETGVAEAMVRMRNRYFDLSCSL